MERARARAALVLVLAVAPLAAGCARLPLASQWFGASASVEERAAYTAALAPLPGDPEQAEVLLEAFVRQYPESPLADDALVRLGGIAFDRDDRAAALRPFRQVVELYPGSDRADAARVYAARLELAGGNEDAARRLIAGVRLGRLEPEERLSAYRLLADAAPDPVARLRWLARLREEEEDPAALATVDAKVVETAASLDLDELERAARQIGPRRPAERVWLVAAGRALDRGEPERARAALEAAAALPLDPVASAGFAAAEARLAALERGPVAVAELPTFREVARREPPPVAGARGTVGVVLPLSGPFARFGEETLAGILLAAEIFGPHAAAGPEVHLEIRDSGGYPDRAAAAVDELASRRDVAAVLGPLLSNESEAAAAAAESRGVPLVALTARESAAAARAHVFRLRTRPVEEVQVLVDHAVDDLGAERFAILYPRDAFGRGLRALFWDAVEARGGTLTGVASYDPEATDFAEPIRRLVGYVMLTDAEKRAIEERARMLRRARRLPTEEAAALRAEARELTSPDGDPLPPIVDFDALFVPESHEKVVLIAPQLAFHEAAEARLLGPSAWWDASLVQLGRHHVEGARFTAQFFAGSPMPFVREFDGRYEAAFDAEPRTFAAHGYDAARLVLVQLAAGRNSREALRVGLLETRGYPGVSGVLTMGADGNAQKRPYLLGVERGRIVQVDP